MFPIEMFTDPVIEPKQREEILQFARGVYVKKGYNSLRVVNDVFEKYRDLTVDDVWAISHEAMEQVREARAIL